MSSTPERHFGSFSWSATKANTSDRGRLTTMLFSAAGMRATLLRDEGACEILGIERTKIVQRLPYADQLHGQAELVRDRDGDAALRAAVELRQRYAGDPDRLAEEPRLLQAVLSRRRVHYEQRLVRRAVEPALDHAAHLRELLHQVRLRVQPAGGVDDDDVRAVTPRPLDCVVGDRGRVRPALSADERRVGTVRPDLELFLRSRAERVGCGQHDRVPVLAQPLCELSDRRRLAGAVDADH